MAVVAEKIEIHVNDNNCSKNRLSSTVNATLDLFKGLNSAHMGSIIYQARGNGKRLANFTNRAEYHPNWGARKLLEEKGHVVAQEIIDTRRLIIVGHGDKPEKEKILLPHLINLQEVIGIDLVPEYRESFIASMEEYKRVLGKNFKVSAHTMDVTNPNATLPINNKPQTTVISTGSTVSNISYEPQQGEPIPSSEMLGFLIPLKALAGEGGKVVIEFDTTIERSTLENAYGDGLLSDFFQAGMRKAISECNKADAIRGITAKDIENTFVFRPEIGNDPTCVYHRLEVISPKTIELLNPETNKYKKKSLKIGDQFTLMVSPKPSDNEMLGLAKTIGLEERQTVKKSAIAIQTFKVAP